MELAALLKAHGVKDIVISPGSRHYAFTRTFENDQYFRLHSVVDERSAAFFALGLTQATGEPTATICTSGTAALNYGSAIAEASAQKLPLIAITTDRLPDFLGQMEDQMIDQRELFDGFVRYTGNLRPISNDRDRWYCNRVINEGLVAAREGGPVHLNVPIESHSGVEFTVAQLPDVRVIARHRIESEEPDWAELAKRLEHKRVLVVWGQGARPSDHTIARLSAFTESFDAVVISDHLANLHIDRRIDNPLAFLRIPAAKHPELKPEIVISFGGNIVFKDELKGYLHASDHEHWRVDPDGAIADPFRTLTDVFQSGPQVFLERIVAARDASADPSYRRRMLEVANSIPAPSMEHGELAVIGALMRALPHDSSLHIANSAPIRMAQLHRIDPSIDVLCNRGVNGIDGCLSTAIGYAAATAKPTFVIIGDLTFFYDMNSLWIRDLPDNLRILLLNNGGGAVMHVPLPESYSATVAGRHVSAEHAMSARGWVESLGIDYSAAHTPDATAAGISWLTDLNEHGSRVLEVFSNKVADIAQLRAYHSTLAGGGVRPGAYIRIRRLGGRVLRRLGLR
ncbi:2-succinyl-5-enolpyruvyl-6-hydroxy-3-cyclohexene-1-carboxylic-acid synthase [Agromyces sp. SYSU K20354]|uniref:2-succinyl-5-enolpyruvyl-6-hydroxy-3- cyclohexene-1-carboxylic-acid synthase n=1 Tax=Agromyces cavernae TaxID=2898659 RepID=UPI001E341CCD|nr:2-succinyl-5-enolpyruvyl-6-hydroxy-3-cyclohexene-1-carboxylic-acid synthase [Agromyces cavernae]MCD2441005.1 2-succinyl-5-enolpyruvyl-6-hydroxy-3-cyclohexene-1-carboxylic-acid synthase [Agromyces cavernae]